MSRRAWRRGLLVAGRSQSRIFRPRCWPRGRRLLYATILQQDLNPQVVGAKAANLGRAIGLGLTVPTGLVVTRQALRLFLEEAGLLATAERAVSAAEADRTSRAARYEALCADVMKAPIPRSITEAVASIASPLQEKAPHGLAVRSSGDH